MLIAGVQRLRGVAFAQSGNDDGAAEGWAELLAVAIGASVRHEEALTFDALSRHVARRGDADEWDDRARAIIADLGADTPPPIAV